MVELPTYTYNTKVSLLSTVYPMYYINNEWSLFNTLYNLRQVTLIPCSFHDNC